MPPVPAAVLLLNHEQHVLKVEAVTGQMVWSPSCAFLVSIADRDLTPADGYWSAQISHRIRFNRGCLRGQDTCRLRNQDIGRGRIQKGRLSIVCREKFSLFPPRSCAHRRLTVAG